MTYSPTLEDRISGAFFGMFIGDALAMPVHWYYNTQALRRDYGEVTDFLQPRNPHPDSILWRSSYSPVNSKADILHEQAQYWGVKGIHYHQFLKPGENTLNLKLARELLILIQQKSYYSSEIWLERMIEFLTFPGAHNDTYAEEYLRHFFMAYAQGSAADECGRSDEKHIGGYSLMLPLVLAYCQAPEYARQISLEHLALTHGGHTMYIWGDLIARALLYTIQGQTLRDAIMVAVKESNVDIDVVTLESFSNYPDTTVVGKHFSSACYVEYAVPATLYLALKYADSPEEGLIANTMCGGDNAGRGTVLGALLGAACGIKRWPRKWRDGLISPPPFVQLKKQ